MLHRRLVLKVIGKALRIHFAPGSGAPRWPISSARIAPPSDVSTKSKVSIFSVIRSGRMICFAPDDVCVAAAMVGRPIGVTSS
jgi:hypothetical protein